MPPTDVDRRQLDKLGYLVLEGFMSADLLARLRRRVEELFAEEGESAGSEFKPEPGCRRLANLVDKGAVFREILLDPVVLACVRRVLGDDIKLSSLNARSVPPDGSGRQPLHADMSAVADERGNWVCNTVWMLDDFRPDNGALRLVPGSHRRRQLPGDVLSDPLANHPDEVLVTGQAGSVVVLNAHVWHGGSANHSAAPRTAVHAFFCRRDKPQQQYQERLLRPEVQAGLSAELRYLLALDDAVNDRLSAEVAVRSGFLK
jgi:ectoine hydroxylase-related dioxygenase (phytanoyl-CoA dioxygenase family)